MAKILVVEDVAAVLLSIRIILTGNAHDISVAADGAQGLQQLSAQPFDLVISDIWMPALSGLELIRQGRTLAPVAKFLAITGGDPNSRPAASSRDVENFGADAVLYKPFEKFDLLAAVEKLLTEN